MNDIEQRVSRALGGLADGVRAPEPALADTIIHRGKVVRRRRAVATSIAAVVVIAIAIPSALALANSGHDKPSGIISTGSPEPTPRDSQPAAPVTLLPEGAVPAVPYTTNAAPWELVHGSVHVPLPDHRFSALFANVADGGYLVQVHGAGFTGAEDPDADLRVVEPSGIARTIYHGEAYGAVVNPAGTLVAFGVPTNLSLDMHLVIARLSDASVVASTDVAHTFAVPIAFTDDGVVLDMSSTRTNGSPTGTLAVWSGSSGAAPTTVADHVSPGEVSADGKHALVQSGYDQDCATLLRLPSGTQEWTHCAFPEAVSPNGSIVLVGHSDCWQSIRVRDNAATTFACGLGNREPVWEDGTHVLGHVTAHAHGTFVGYVVRCDVTTGQCERALGPVSNDLDLMR
jgi:hypothetical protein